jgi:hypothetical protein
MRSYRRGPRPPTAPPLVAVAGEVASGRDTTPGSDSSRSAVAGEIAPGRPLHLPITSLPFAVADEVATERTLRPASVSPLVAVADEVATGRTPHLRSQSSPSAVAGEVASEGEHCQLLPANPVSEPHNRSHRHRRQQPLRTTLVRTDECCLSAPTAAAQWLPTTTGQHRTTTPQHALSRPLRSAVLSLSRAMQPASICLSLLQTDRAVVTRRPADVASTGRHRPRC